MERAEHIGKIAIICYLNKMRLTVKEDGGIKVSMTFQVGLTGSRMVSYHEEMPTYYTVECVEELATRYTNKESADEIEFAISQFKPW